MRVDHCLEVKLQKKPTRQNNSTLRRLTATVLSVVLSCGAPSSTNEGHVARHPGLRNEAFERAAQKHGVPVEVLMVVAYHQTRFELPDNVSAGAVSFEEPPSVSSEMQPVDVSREREAEAPADDYAEPVAVEPALSLAPDWTDQELEFSLDTDTAPLDAEAADATETDNLEATQEGDVHVAGTLYGIMALSEEQIAAAAQLLSAPAQALRTDLNLNVEAAAVLLARQAPNVGAHADRVAAWAEAIGHLVGSDDDAEVQALLLQTLIDIEKSGFDIVTLDGEEMQLLGASGTLETALQALRAGDYPKIEFIPASSRNYSSRSGGKVRFVVIHDIEGTMPGAIAVFRNPNRQASAHYIIRARDGHVVQMVSEANKAWHSGNGYFNANSIGIEHEGFADRPAGGGYYNATQYQASAGLVCAIVKKYKIPVDRKHIFGHGNVPSSNSSTTLCSDASSNAGRCGGASHHHDPGRFWDWSTYMRLVARCASGTSVPSNPSTSPPAALTTVKGLITSTVTNRPVSGATVRVGTRTATSTSNGLYVFERVSRGNQVISASASQYLSQSLTRAVSGSETWGSIALKPTPPSGTAILTGVVYRGSSSSNRVAGARVTLSNGRSTTTNSFGVYEFRQLAPGTLRITATRSGVGTGSTSRTVTNGTTTWGSVKL